MGYDGKRGVNDNVKIVGRTIRRTESPFANLGKTGMNRLGWRLGKPKEFISG